jgi:hypothetical protein
VVFTTGGIGLLAGVVFLASAQGERATETVPPSPYDARLIALDREALDDAYRAQVVSLFTNWMKDPHGQPARALNGVRAARQAYIAAMTEIEKRERKQ